MTPPKSNADTELASPTWIVYLFEYCSKILMNSTTNRWLVDFAYSLHWIEQKSGMENIKPIKRILEPQQFTWCLWNMFQVLRRMQEPIASPAVVQIPQETCRTPAGWTHAPHAEIVLGRVEMPWDMPWLAGKFPGPMQWNIIMKYPLPERCPGMMLPFRYTMVYLIWLCPPRSSWKKMGPVGT